MRSSSIWRSIIRSVRPKLKCKLLANELEMTLSPTLFQNCVGWLRLFSCLTFLKMKFRRFNILEIEILRIWHFWKWQHESLTFLKVTFLKPDISENDIFKAWHFWRWHSESLTFLKMRIIKSDISERDIYNIWHFWKSFAKNFNHPKHDPKILLLNITPLYDPFIWSPNMTPN